MAGPSAAIIAERINLARHEARSQGKRWGRAVSLGECIANQTLLQVDMGSCPGDEAAQGGYSRTITPPGAAVRWLSSRMPLLRGQDPGEIRKFGHLGTHLLDIDPDLGIGEGVQHPSAGVARVESGRSQFCASRISAIVDTAIPSQSRVKRVKFAQVASLCR